MLWLLLSMSLMIAALAGFGAAIERWLVGRPSEYDFTKKCLLGMLGLSVLGMLLNFFAPLNEWITGAAFLVGFIALILYRKSVVSSLGKDPAKMLGLFVLLLFAYAAGAMRQDFMSDAGVYHVPALTWLYESPIPLGAANLHSRLGYNTSWFPLAAMFRVPGLGLTGIFAINAVLFSIVIFGFLRHLIDPVVHEPRRAVSLFAAIILLVLGISGSDVFYFQIRGVATDAPALLLVLYAFFLGMRCLASTSSPQTSSHRDADCMLLWVVTLLAVMVKLSALPLILLPIYVHVVTGRNNGDRLFPPKLAIVMVAALGIWLMRGVGLSGCLAFPQPHSCMTQLPWTVSDKLVTEEARTIRNFARAKMAPWSYSDGWEWIPEWSKRIREDRVVVRSLILIVGGIALFTLGTLRRVGSLIVDRWSWLHLGLPGIALVGLLFWFFQGPEPRFGYGFMLAFGGSLLSIGGMYAGISKETVLRTARWITLGAVVFASLHGLHQFYRLPQGSILDPSWPSFPAARYDARPNYQGKIILVPASGLCWNLAGLCTPYFDARLTIDRFLIWSMFRSSDRPGR